MKAKKTTSVRLDNDLMKKIVWISKRENRSVNNTIETILIKCVDDVEKGILLGKSLTETLN